MTTTLLRARPAGLPGVRRRRDIPLIVAISMLTVFVAAAALAPLLTQIDPTVADFNRTYRPMEPGAILGTDSSGRDIFSRILFGARTSLVAPR